MSDVPSELFREILLRLPADSLFRVRSVCKTWLRIIDDPSFVRTHTGNQLYNHTLLVRNETGAPIYSFSLDSLSFLSVPQNVDAIFIKQLIREDVARLRDLFLVAFCNGLILLSNAPFSGVKRIWAIWNPLTMECHELPQPNCGSPIGFGFGFGYDPDADDYKVVRIDRLYSAGVVGYVFRTLVYSLKSDSWSMIEDCTYLSDMVSPSEMVSPGVFLNGKLYWSANGMIISLDLITESYSQFPMPIETTMMSDCRLDALDGCLIFSSSHYIGVLIDGWVMNENGIDKSWTKLFSLRCYVFDVDPGLKLVAYLKGKQQVVLQHRQGFLWFDIENNSVKKVSVHGFPRITSAQICPGSLVRLSVGFGDVTEATSARKRKRKSKKRYTRLKICIRDGDQRSSNCCPEDAV